MSPRRRQGGSKKSRALRGLISRELPELRVLAGLFNRDGGVLDGDPDGAVTAGAAAVVDALGESEPPHISRQAAERFNALVGDASFRYKATSWATLGMPERLLDTHWGTGQYSTTPGASIAIALSAFFSNPQRQRLRRCQQCARWFVDETRNRSQRRCSRACTIAWSNKQRPKGGAR
jgi:hypothetical protein